MGLLGAHVSIAGGIENAVARGEVLRCDAVQVFTRNQRQWKSKPLDEDSVLAFREALTGSSVKQVIAHDSYLINLASPDEEMLEKSRRAFLEELDRSEHMGLSGLVFHPGAHKGDGVESGIERIAESLNIILKESTGKAKLLLETTAGNEERIGARFEHLRDIISKVDDEERMGVCFDTSHAFASGYDIRTEKAYEETFRRFEEVIGLDRLQAFHLNDSKSDLGSGIDRHENIRKGFIGKEAFRFLVNDGRFENTPMILETPGGEVWFKKNLSLLRSMIH